MTRTNTGEACGDTTSEGYVCTLLKGHSAQHYDHEHHHWPLAPPSTVASSIWTFSAEDFEREAQRYSTIFGVLGSGNRGLNAMLRSAAALRREVERLEEIVAAKDMAFDCANENVLAAEREVARLTQRSEGLNE